MSQLTLSPSAAGSAKTSRQPDIRVLKRRLLRVGLLLILGCVLYSMLLLLLGQTSYPSNTPYLVTDVLVISTCVAALTALRNLKHVRLVEIGLCALSLVYLLYWDMVLLLSGLLPRAEYQMTASSTFLLCAALMCLSVPRQHLPLALAGLFGLHEVLTWGALLHFPWGRLHSSQLINDVTLLVIMLCLSLIGAYQHLTLLAQQEAELMQRLAHTDPLTGLANRRQMYAALQSQHPTAVLLMDLDNFKALNDTFGHDAGDLGLVSVAAQLREVFGPSGQVGRWGGEEFIALLGHVSAQQALWLAEEVRGRIEQAGTHTNLPLTMSIGVAFAHPEETPTQTIKRADDLLYLAKREGKNRVYNAG